MTGIDFWEKGAMDREQRKHLHHDSAVTPPKLTILSDLPLDQAETYRDTFDLEFRLGPIYDILRHPKTRTPMAMAVYGDWGAGKTSAMRWLDDKLSIWNGNGNDPDKISVKTVWFYPWKYHCKNDVWRGLISEVIIKSIEIEGATVKTVTNAAKRFAGFLGRSFVNVLANITLKANVGAAEADLSLSSIKQIIEEYHEAAHPEKAFLNEFEDTLKSWLKDTLRPNERMVIFIDDLDRCMPDVALEVLEALKLYLNIEKLLFVVGIDRGVIDQLVSKHYETLGVGKDKSGKYLAKMFQVEVPVEPSETQTEAYLDDQLGEIDLWTDMSDTDKDIFRKIILKRAGRNPREVKRLINSALMFGAGAIMGSKTAESEDKKVGFPQGLQIFFIREILDKVHNRPGLRLERVGQRFFAMWSQIVCENPNLPRSLPASAISYWKKTVSPDASREQAKLQHEMGEMFDESSPDISPQYEIILTDPAFQSLLPLLQDVDLGELMQIPYSEAGAEALLDKMTTPVQPDDIIRELLANMVRIPEGTFQMGSENGDEDEKPVHPVKLSPFYISRTPITQAQYEAVMGTNPSHFKGQDNPVDSVSWNDAMAFCEKLSSKSKNGEKFTLPTEAQWEYACRAGSTAKFCYGDDAEQLGEYAWYDQNSEGQTHPVGEKAPNAWGLYDMHGSVWEWCLDWYGEYPTDPVTDPRGPESGDSRVLRGGSWCYLPYYCRSAYRNCNIPDLRRNNVGFRVARTP